jgi:hypothetical protein
MFYRNRSAVTAVTKQYQIHSFFSERCFFIIKTGGGGGSGKACPAVTSLFHCCNFNTTIKILRSRDQTNNHFLSSGWCCIKIHEKLNFVLTDEIF